MAKVRLVGDRIVDISTIMPHRKALRLPDEDIWIAPGFIDIQVNGFAGIDFNHPNFSGDDLVGVCRHLLSTGVTRFCPTLITAGYKQLVRNIEEIRQACQRHSLVRSMVLGIHLEGPYLNCAEFAGITLASAIKMVTENPAVLFDGISGKLEQGQRADLVLFRAKGKKIRILRVYLAGRLLHSAE